MTAHRVLEENTKTRQQMLKQSLIYQLTLILGVQLKLKSTTYSAV